LSESTCSEAEGPPIVNPPMTFSRPSNVVKEHEHRGTDILGSAVHVFAAGSNISASDNGLPSLPVNVDSSITHRTFNAHDLSSQLQQDLSCGQFNTDK